MQSANTFNVTGLNPNTVYSDIQTFLNDESFSDGTRKEYEHDIRYFFAYNNKPSIEVLTPSELQFDVSDVFRYRNHLSKDKQLAPTTINRKIAALQSLYSFFRINRYETKYNIDTNVFKVKKLKGKSNSYGHLAEPEVNMMMDLVKSQVKGYEKYCLIKLASRSSLREDTLLNLTFDDIVKDENSEYYLINAYEKKNDQEMTMPITAQFYEELLKIKELPYYQKYSDNKLFHLTVNTISSMMKNLCEQLNISESRRIVFHSLRSYAPNFIIDTQNDLKAAQLQSGHKDVNTLWTHYINKNKDYSQMAGVLLDEVVDHDAFDKLTYEEMKQLLTNTKNGVRSQLLREATHIINNREDV